MLVRPFLVSLEPSPEIGGRLQALFPLPINRIGIDGRRLPASEYFRFNAARLREGLAPLTPAELGCALSHLHALEDFLASSAELAVIFEDDVIARIGPADDLPAVLQLAADYDLVMLSEQFGQSATHLLHGWRKPEEGVFGHPFWEIPQKFQRYLQQTTAYAVNRSFAGYLVEQQHKTITHADAWRTWFGRRRCRVAYTPVFAHPRDLSSSLIEPERRAMNGRTGVRADRNISAYRRIRCAMRGWSIKAEKCV
ncbi:MAG: glycosyltransferase family 25 protein [Panacagrimonas sp.]